jgi:hypothetical protein
MEDRVMKKSVLITLCVLVATGTAMAHWDPCDPYKMHYPQLPDPLGWDIDVVPGNSAADDWQCSQSGFVDDIHFWYSWEQDVVGVISKIAATIWSNTPAGQSPTGFSIPGNVLWTRDFYPGQFDTRWYGEGDQSFYDAGAGWIPNDHNDFYQCNIVDIVDPFFQVEDTIYWLELSITINDPLGTHIGWKTSPDHFMDTAVFKAEPWVMLIDPGENHLDLAFVITPEPATVMLLGLGGLLLRRRR